MDITRIWVAASDAIARGRSAVGSVVVLAKKHGGPMIPFLLSPLGRIAGTILIAAIAWFGWLHNHDKKVVARVSAQIEKKVEAHAQKADEVRNSMQSVPADRLRGKGSRD